MTRTFHPLVLGKFPSPQAYLMEIRSLPCHRVDEWTEHILLKHLTCAKERIEIDIATFPVEDLGLDRYASHAAVDRRIEELGYEPCPAEVGPALCLMSDALSDGSLFVVMKPVSDHIFTFWRDGDRGILSTWLADDWASQRGRVVVALPSAIVTL